ncbi:unnamed protein product, partial [Brenthis ino]
MTGFTARLRSRMSSLRPQPASRHCDRGACVFMDLPSANHVYVIDDRIKGLLQAAYSDPYKVLQTGETSMADSEKRTSKAWLYFTDLKNNKAKCNFCSKVMSYKGGGPYNLTRHTKSQHPGVLDSVSVPPTDDSPPTAVGSTSENFTENTENFDFFYTNCMFLICSLPCRKTLTNALLRNYYNIEKDKIKKQLEKADYVAITTDGWTSKPNENYIALSVHFLDKNTELRSRMLECHVTEEMSSEKKVTISQVILISNALKREYCKFLARESLPETVRQMAQVLFDELSTRFYNIEENNILAESTLLDPRFKKHGFVNDTTYGRACSNLKQLVAYVTLQRDVENDTDAEKERQPQSPNKKTRSIWDEFD